MENLHEMGHRFRELKKKRVRLAVEAIGFLLLAALFVWGATTIDRLETELARARMTEDRGRETGGRTDTVMIGLKRAVLADGDVVLRIGIVGEEGSEEGGVRTEDGGVRNRTDSTERTNRGGRK